MTMVMCVNYLIVVWFSIVIYWVMRMCFCHFVGSKLCVSAHQNSYWIEKMKMGFFKIWKKKTLLIKCEIFTCNLK
jgi:hypothetical protein